MVVVVLVSAALLGLVVLLLNRGVQSERTAARSQNYDLSLSAAEAGVSEATARIQASGGTFEGSVSGETPAGTYSGSVTKEPGDQRYVVEMTGTSGGDQLGRTRKVQVTLKPPEDTFRYALFSRTSLELKNNDIVIGDVWANDSITTGGNDEITGSVTSAQSWLLVAGGTWIEGPVWTGGFDADVPFAIELESNAEIRGAEGDAKASVSDPSTSCGDSNYKVVLGSGSKIAGDLTTCGAKSGSGGTVEGTYTPNTYTAAAVPKPMPTFSFNANNYDPATYHEFSSVDDFQTWLDGNKTSMEGTFWVSDPNASQSNRIDLTGATLVGDTTIVTDAPVFTNGVDDDPSTDKEFVLVTHYESPSDTACDVNDDSSECAVHVKNNFDVDAEGNCSTRVLIYADNGPVAVKNNQKMCGSIYADAILVKNNQTLEYAPSLAGTIGFGTVTYEVVRWEELPAS